MTCKIELEMPFPAGGCGDCWIADSYSLCTYLMNKDYASCDAFDINPETKRAVKCPFDNK